MEMPVKSKVEEISLRPHEFLLPLFEVIVNSIISIARNKVKSGLIEIYINREEETGMFSSGMMVSKDGNVLPSTISSIEVVDNGAGFSDENFQSFNEVYTQHNKKYGCKGVGRFTMLACFEEVEINSIYKVGEKQWKRSFKFNVENEVYPKDGEPMILEEKTKHETSVKLKGYKKHFKTRSRVSLREIAEGIIDHCIPFFIGSNPPTVILHATFIEDKIILNDILNDVIKFDGKEIDFYPLKNSEVFYLRVIKRTEGRLNRLRLCANNRVVGKNKNLSILIPELESPLKDKDGSLYCIDVHIKSEFLDRSVNSLRNSFNIMDEPEDTDLPIPEITMRDIEDTIKVKLTDKYRDSIERLQDENLRRIRAFIMDPKKLRVRYRSLLSRPDLLKKIPYNSSNEKLEEGLVKIKITLEKELSNSLKHALKKTRPEDYEEYSSIVRKYIDQEAKFAKDKLADLVLHRKGVLELIKRLLKLNKDGKYSLEEDLHNVIFPMGQNADSLPFEYHNLWLLDERLSFHSYVASDKKLRTNPHVSSDSHKEADLLIFDFPWAFSEKERELSSMVIFEFKRPGKDVSGESDKKLDNLVMKYFEDLLQDKARNADGELLNMQDTTPKFGFIICDIDKGLSDYNIRFNDFRKTPNDTLYKIITPLNLHIEAMSYKQMITMSEKRHYAFFKELEIDQL